MKNMTLSNIAAACNGQLIAFEKNTNKEISGVVIDSRLVDDNFLFIATDGERVDGHDFINSAFDKGASAVLCEKVPENPKGPYILVEDSLLALRQLATCYRMQLDIKVVGITGSVGKTSTKEFVSSVLSQKYKVLKTEGNFNNEIGLPLTVLRLRSEHEIAVLEMGINHFGEMHRLSEIAKPDIILITNIGDSHLEYLGSREGVLKAKTEIFDFMKDDGKVILNGNDDMLATIKEVKGQKPIFFGIPDKSRSNGSKLDIFAENIKPKGLLGSTCLIKSKNQESLQIKANIPIPGKHMIDNALAAASTGLALGIPSQMISRGIEGVQPLDGRNNIIHHDKYTIIDDCYNANPSSMKAALDLLDTADTRKVAILGDMGELGDNQVSLHKEIGKYYNTKNIDILVSIGPLSKNIYDKALTKQTPSPLDSTNKLYYYENKEDFIQAFPSILAEGDTVLIKASNYMGFEKIVNKLINISR